MEQRIYLKLVQDIDTKLMLCKSNFQWKILAKQYEEVEEKVKNKYEDQVPDELNSALSTVRLKLVEKKGELPPEDLIV